MMIYQIANIQSSIIWILFTIVNPPLTTAEDADEGISVIKTNSSSIVLSWKIEHNINFVDDLRWLIVKYRLQGRLPYDKKPRLEYDRVSDCYRARWDDVDESEYAWKTINITDFREDAKTISNNEMLITTSGLFADMQYEFILTRVRSAYLWRLGNRTTSIVAKTRAPEPKSGPGCFRIVDVGVADRLVNIYWGGVGETDEYLIEIREEGTTQNKWRKVREERGRLYQGHKIVIVSHKPHWIILKRMNHPEVGDSAIYVPRQREMLGGPANLRVKWNQHSGEHVVTWTKPAGIDVTNYTLVWMDAHRAFNGHLLTTFLDFVFVPGDRTSVRVNSNELGTFFLAANTKTSTSGLYLASDV